MLPVETAGGKSREMKPYHKIYIRIPGWSGLGMCRRSWRYYDLNGFAISFMESLYLVKKEIIAPVMDQMELSAVFNMMEIFLFPY